jgi:hypothetical protein
MLALKRLIGTVLVESEDVEREGPFEGPRDGPDVGSLVGSVCNTLVVVAVVGTIDRGISREEIP